MNRCLLIWMILIVLVATLSPAARASIDAPGQIDFNWYADDNQVLDAFPQIPDNEPRFIAEAYFNSDASMFGSEGVFIWAGFELEGGTEPRYGILLLDLDITRAPLDGLTPIPHGAIRAEYIEKWAQTVYFAGEASLGDVWIDDIYFHEDDKGVVSGAFEMLFTDPDGTYNGSRVFMRGRFSTDPSPEEIRQNYNLPPNSSGSDVSVATGCSGEFYVADDRGCDCGGEDPDSGGCEGDTADDAGCSGGCESDSSSSGGSCEGDSGGCEGGGGGGGCGDGPGACSGGAKAAVDRYKKYRQAPLRFLTRYFPEILVLFSIFFMKRRNRKNCK